MLSGLYDIVHLAVFQNKEGFLGVSTISMRVQTLMFSNMYSYLDMYHYLLEQTTCDAMVISFEPKCQFTRLYIRKECQKNTKQLMIFFLE